jgi:DNA recombination protein RmuC
MGSLERQVLPGARKFTELGIRPDKELESIDTIDALARTPLGTTQTDEPTPTVNSPS